MKVLLVLTTLWLAAKAASDEELWTQFKLEHGKTYKSLVEEKLRFSVFKSNLRQIEQHNNRYNNGEESYYLQINQFSDLTNKEFKDIYTDFKLPVITSAGVYLPENASVPDSIDWREKGAVLEVKDQGICGSCWAFSMTGALEGQNAILFNERVSLSEKQLMDCNSLKHGCFGGPMKDVYQDMRGKTLFTEESYPYKPYEGQCKQGVSAGIRIKNSLSIPNDEEVLKNVVGTLGPATIGMCGTDIQQYGGGIYNNPNCCKVLTHATVAVGYGTKNNLDYWIIKNSWGPKWGDKGFIYVIRNQNQQCGIGTYSVIPEIEKSE